VQKAVLLLLRLLAGEKMNKTRKDEGRNKKERKKKEQER
jgi:hypothetical protein